MAPRKDNPKAGKGRKGRKLRVPFRRNRQQPRREKDWTSKAHEAEDFHIDDALEERVTPKGDLSRQRTIIVDDEGNELIEDLRSGVVVAMRGLFAEVDDGDRIWPCTVRRILRTRRTEERHRVTVGDQVDFRVAKEAEGVVQEGVIERVADRKSQLRRRARRRVHTIAANIDQAVIVSSTAEPDPKPHLIDRYIVASLAGGITPVVCMNKMDLDDRGFGAPILERYEVLGYRTLSSSAVTGEGVDVLKEVLKGKSSVIAGQSGVGKSSLLNAVQPDLNLQIGDIVEQTQKGRHTTSTATLIRLRLGGYVVDTPGVKSLDISTVEKGEIEVHFLEFQPHIPDCKFPDCTHTHETDCAVKAAVEAGLIHPERYESYVRMFEEPWGTENW
ncbi:MAG: ribosome small subunit-dependent GTPase A [Phycisphaerales bacterium]|nr:MAG: ribosome small subunit-dependent GTPase A [Phycisphaerales bacterium]